RRPAPDRPLTDRQPPGHRAGRQQLPVVRAGCRHVRPWVEKSTRGEGLGTSSPDLSFTVHRYTYQEATGEGRVAGAGSRPVAGRGQGRGGGRENACAFR